MIDIFELDDEQLREYSSSLSDEARDGYALDDAISKFKYIEKQLEKQNKYFSIIGQLLKEKRLDEVYDKCADAGISLDRLSTRVKTFPFEIGEKSSNKKIRLDKADGTGKKLIFEKNNGFLRIILPEMLPHKQQYDSQTGRMHFYYDIDAWKANYYEQFAKEFERGKYHVFSEKVSLCYIIHVSPDMRSGISDTDNYDTKVMTDIITTFLLPDDNFLCCNYMVDVVLDNNIKEVEECYTDIIICPSENREKVLKEL